MGLLSRLFGAAPVARLPLLHEGLGVFGKLPASGDFVSLGMDHGLRERVDDWLSRGMLALASAPDGLRYYAAAPTWCALIAADLLAEVELGLVLAPSADRVGRDFPLSVLIQPEVGESKRAFAARVQSVADALARSQQARSSAQALRRELIEAASRGSPLELPPSSRSEDVSLWWPAHPAAQSMEHRGALDEALFLRLMGMARDV